MLFQEAPAETTAYMIVGFLVIFGVMLVYLTSMLVRRRNLLNDLETLQEIEKDL